MNLIGKMIVAMWVMLIVTSVYSVVKSYNNVGELGELINEKIESCDGDVDCEEYYDNIGLIEGIAYAFVIFFLLSLIVSCLLLLSGLMVFEVKK